MPFLLCIRLGSEAILRGCLGAARLEEQQAGQPAEVDGGGGGEHHHPPGAPHLAARSPPPAAPLSSVFPLTSKCDKPTYELQLEYWAVNAPTSSAAAIAGGGGSISGAGGGGGGVGGFSSSLVHSLSLDDRGSGAGGGAGVPTTSLTGGNGGGSVDGRSVHRPVTFKAVCRSMLVGLASSPLSAPLHQLQKPSTLLSLAMVTREKKPKSKSLFFLNHLNWKKTNSLFFAFSPSF